MSDKRLGKGIKALIRSEDDQKDFSSKTRSIEKIPLKDIFPNPSQPRRNFNEDALLELSQSIKEKGVITPITVRKVDSGYEIIAGERRWRATQLLNKDTISAIIVDVDEKTSAVMSIVENVQREDLNPMEEAESLKRLIDEFEMSHDDVSKYISKSRAHVSNLIRLNELCVFGKEQLRIGTISMGHARAVLSLGISEQTKIIKEDLDKQSYLSLSSWRSNN